jgi:DNA polymerase
MTGIMYDKLAKDLKSDNPAVKAAAKGHRQVAKPGVLGCVYRLGPGQISTNKHGDQVKTGLWGYSEAMGVSMTQDKAQEVVQVFRQSYPEICEMWYSLEEAVSDVLKGQRTKRELGPDGCIKIDKIPNGDTEILRIQLPSGRRLHYLEAQIKPTKMPWTKLNDQGEEEEVYKPTLNYASVDQETKQWGYTTSHGGKIFENIVQGTARDVLAEQMLRFEEWHLNIVAHVHDEIIVECDTDELKLAEEIMSRSIDWAPGLPLAAEGWRGNYYRKG